MTHLRPWLQIDPRSKIVTPKKAEIYRNAKSIKIMVTSKNRLSRDGGTKYVNKIGDRLMI